MNDDISWLTEALGVTTHVIVDPSTSWRPPSWKTIYPATGVHLYVAGYIRNRFGLDEARERCERLGIEIARAVRKHPTDQDYAMQLHLAMVRGVLVYEQHRLNLEHRSFGRHRALGRARALKKVTDMLTEVRAYLTNIHGTTADQTAEMQVVLEFDEKLRSLPSFADYDVRRKPGRPFDARNALDPDLQRLGIGKEDRTTIHQALGFI